MFYSTQESSLVLSTLCICYFKKVMCLHSSALIDSKMCFTNDRCCKGNVYIL